MTSHEMRERAWYVVVSGAAAGAAADGVLGGARHSQQGACSPADPSASRRKRRG